MKYEEALEYMDECAAYGIVPGLDNMRELMHRLSDPQDALKFIHIAGTNGKGSIVANISSVLSGVGIRTARYTSPAVFDYRERYEINGRMISRNKLASYISLLRDICDRMVEDGYPHPTQFEIETAIAFKYFYDSKAEIVLLETGMGGTLDATNIVTTTLMEVMAHIDLDHMQYLGETLREIASCKAGIIKPDTVVVTGPQSEEVSAVIRETSDRLNCSLCEVYPDNITGIRLLKNKRRFRLIGLPSQFGIPEGTVYETPLMGSCQVENTAVAVAALFCLKNRYGKEIIRLGRLTADRIRDELALVEWRGRFQKVNDKPLLIIDGAHNVDAAMRLRETVDELYHDRRKIYIVGMFRDKPVKEVLDIMIKDGEMVFTVATPGNKRALESVKLAQIAGEINPNTTSCDSVEEAVEMAGLMAGDTGVIICFGSLAYLSRVSCAALQKWTSDDRRK
ncbi:MAG: bifunctional folylpolyglutamate synthase/dihydrofolate synthase [Lachnospiraceae bacterium]|nr:bifunctional folylpolyglutamate synthase/dihydrofolate synthase [Lachnospiraceae bacterium]